MRYNATLNATVATSSSQTVRRLDVLRSSEKPNTNHLHTAAQRDTS
jgi:hypothetical protein